VISARQYEIAKRWAESSKVRKELAEEFHVSESAIKGHLQKVYRHFGIFGCTTRLELAKIYADTKEHWRDWPTFLKWRSHE
jgi:DNA-binding CsgD family transcriptional regulator